MYREYNVAGSEDRSACPVQAALIKHGIKPTRQRLRIAAQLLAEPQHLSADQVLSRVNRADAKVSRATVYNTLGLFVEKGLINMVLIDPVRVFYDSNTCVHGHFFNEDTGELTDFDAAALVSSLDIPANTRANGVDIIIRLKHC